MDTWKAEEEGRLCAYEGTATPFAVSSSSEPRVMGTGCTEGRLCLGLCPVRLDKHGALQMTSVEVLTN